MRCKVGVQGAQTVSPEVRGTDLGADLWGPVTREALAVPVRVHSGSQVPTSPKEGPLGGGTPGLLAGRAGGVAPWLISARLSRPGGGKSTPAPSTLVPHQSEQMRQQEHERQQQQRRRQRSVAAPAAPSTRANTSACFAGLPQGPASAWLLPLVHDERMHVNAVPGVSSVPAYPGWLLDLAASFCQGPAAVPHTRHGPDA
ncbi:hypothetical protein N2152v2_003312 [Parachlorella kessleri]